MKSDEIEYIEEQIKEWRNLITREHYQWMMNVSYNSNYHDDGYSKDFIKRGLKFLYNLILAYMEAKGMKQLSLTFKQEFENKMSDDQFLLREDVLFWDGDPELLVLDDFSRYLSAFKAFSHSNSEQREIDRLKELLSNTPYILKNLNSKITNETSIYKHVKWIIQLYYPSSRKKNKASFIEQFKTYEPDILIPELNTAIEYKYVKKGCNIEDYIDQIKVDATNYKNDFRYDNFFAVLCIDGQEVATKESIFSSWESKMFPNNWKLVVCYI